MTKPGSKPRAKVVSGGRPVKTMVVFDGGRTDEPVAPQVPVSRIEEGWAVAQLPSAYAKKFLEEELRQRRRRENRLDAEERARFAEARAEAQVNLENKKVDLARQQTHQSGMDTVVQTAGMISNRKADWELKIRIISVSASLIVVVLLAVGLIAHLFILMFNGLLGLVVVVPMLGGLLLCFRKLVAGYVLGVPASERKARQTSNAQAPSDKI